MLRFFSRVIIVILVGALLITAAHLLYLGLGPLLAAIFIFCTVFFFVYTSSVWIRFILPSQRYEGEHRSELDKLLRQHKAGVAEIYLRPKDRLGAYACGLFGFRTITFTSKTLESCAWDGVKVVALHEISHHRRADIFGYGFVAVLVLYASGALLPKVILPLIFADAIFVSLLVLLLLCALSRSRERLADIYAKTYSPNPDIAVTLLEEITREQVAANPMLNHPPLIARLFFTHPQFNDREKIFQA